MTTQEIADQLVGFCRKGEYESAYALYADNAVSMEMEGIPNNVTTGKEQILNEFAQWSENIEEMHGGEVGDPVVAGSHFVVPMTYDITFKDRGREQMEELCLYQVKDGQIVRASFHYELPEMFQA